MFVHRPAIAARGGLVVAGHHLAAEAGAAVLREGGNATDAAVTAAAALAVAIPHKNGIGGDSFALVCDRARLAVAVITGRGGARAQADIGHYRGLGLDEVPQRGPLSISVPGAARAWADALERHGTIPLARALEPAIRLAEDGVPIDRQLRDFFGGPVYAELAATFPELVALYGEPAVKRLGSNFRQPALARTLGAIADKGVGCLYGGAVGQALVEDAGRLGALISEDDLARHASLIQAPLSVTYRGDRVFAAPPNTQGIALLALLGLLEADERAGGSLDEPYLSRFMRLKHVAFEDRDRLVGDPRAAALPPDLLDPVRLAARARVSREDGHRAAHARRTPDGGGDTTSVVAMDRDGNAVSWVQSLFEDFGSGVVSPSTGIVLHNRLQLASLQPGGPNSLAPGRRPFHTLCPALVVGDGRCKLAISTPGDHGQPQSLAQIIVNIWDRKMDVQAAVEAPRIRHDNGMELLYEDRLPEAELRPLADAGYDTTSVGAWSRLMGGVNAIHCPEGAFKMGGADPRRASYAVAE